MCQNVICVKQYTFSYCVKQYTFSYLNLILQILQNIRYYMWFFHLFISSFNNISQCTKQREKYYHETQGPQKTVKSRSLSVLYVFKDNVWVVRIKIAIKCFVIFQFWVISFDKLFHRFTTVHVWSMASIMRTLKIKKIQFSPQKTIIQFFFKIHLICLGVMFYVFTWFDSSHIPFKLIK